MGFEWLKCHETRLVQYKASTCSLCVRQSSFHKTMSQVYYWRTCLGVSSQYFLARASFGNFDVYWCVKFQRKLYWRVSLVEGRNANLTMVKDQILEPFSADWLWKINGWTFPSKQFNKKRHDRLRLFHIDGITKPVACFSRWSMVCPIECIRRRNPKLTTEKARSEAQTWSSGPKLN